MFVTYSLQEEVEAAMQFSEELRQHLVSMLGDIRPHVITNVSLGKKAGVLMKVCRIQASSDLNSEVLCCLCLS
jgi:hypothetical protein